MINFLRWLVAFIIVFCMTYTLDLLAQKYLVVDSLVDKWTVMIAELSFGWFYLYPQAGKIYKQLGGKDE